MRLLACMALLLGAAWAASLRAQSCTMTMPDINFGNVNTLSSTATDIVASGTFNCSGWSTPYVRVCASLGSRSMSGPGGAKLAYDLYIDSARTRPWGSAWEANRDNVLYSDIALSSGAGTASPPVYGRIFGGQGQVPAGAYSQGFLGAGYTGMTAYGYSGTPPTCTTSNGQPNFSFTTRATVVADCQVSATNIDFGQSGILGSPVNATGVITTTCNSGANYTISLSAGQGSGATVASRKLTRSGGGGSLTYNLYRDSARTQLWGDGSSGTGTVALSGTGNAQTSTVYATLSAQTTAATGAYADTVTITVTF